MGQSLSKEEKFIQHFKTAFRERGIRVKKKDLTRFFIFIGDTCPWVVLDGPSIHPKTWKKVKQDLDCIMQTKGPNSIPVQTFTYWTVINEIIQNPLPPARTRCGLCPQLP